jgi:outer membrane protein OmpA-like peptidoglycan-associated protein
MKWRVLKTICAAALASVLFKPAFSQNYYLVIGAFSTENEDIREFTSYLPGQSSDTAFSIQNSNSMMHLYVLKTSDKEMAIASSQKLQQAIERSDGLNSASQNEFRVNVNELSRTGTFPGPDVIAASPSMASGSSSPSAGSAPFKPKGKAFKFTITKDDGVIVPTQVHQVDFERGKELRSFNSNTYVDVLRPVKDQPMALVCGVFGYKMVERFLDYNDPSTAEGAYIDEHGAWVIPYELERLEKGDVSVMYNVSFYKDAVVMLPSSKNEMDELVNLMKMNPNYTIRVHAHCNGKNSRKIIALGPDNNYFDVTGSLEIKGSAKQLTNLRGEAVRSYLKTNGIDEKRVKIYGWGGAEMLTGENTPHAKINDRIEIEILKD